MIGLIRNSSKVIVLQDGKILLNQCRRPNGETYYDLPGGGQHDYETMEEAARREVEEETGYTLADLHLAALGEEICLNPALREKFPDYTHRVFHIFIGEPDRSCPKAPTEKDHSMEKSVWISVDALFSLPRLLPEGLLFHLPEILNGNTIVHLDTYYNEEETV